jgi:hypothetical protein
VLLLVQVADGCLRALPLRLRARYRLTPITLLDERGGLLQRDIGFPEILAAARFLRQDLQIGDEFFHGDDALTPCLTRAVRTDQERTHAVVRVQLADAHQHVRAPAHAVGAGPRQAGSLDRVCL